jgi:preprotein translocase subunit YajC
MIALSLPAVLAMAQTPGAGGGSPSGSLVSTFVPLIVIFVIFYFLMIRPQQKQQKQHRSMLAALKKGDKIVTRGGILGTVDALNENVVTVEIAQNVRIRMSRDAITAVETTK